MVISLLTAPPETQVVAQLHFLGMSSPSEPVRSAADAAELEALVATQDDADDEVTGTIDDSADESEDDESEDESIDDEADLGGGPGRGRGADARGHRRGGHRGARRPTRRSSACCSRSRRCPSSTSCTAPRCG